MSNPERPDTGIPVCSINGPPSFGDLLRRIERLVRQGQELLQLLRQPGPLPEACSCRNSLLFEVAGKTRLGGRDAGPGTEIDLRREGPALAAQPQFLDLGTELLRRGDQLTVQSRLLFSEMSGIQRSQSLLVRLQCRRAGWFLELFIG